MLIRDQDCPFLRIQDLVAARARSHGEQPFLNVVGETVSFAEIDRQSRRVAANLAVRGISRGDRVATFMFNNLAQVVLWFASCRLGAIIAPMNVGLVSDDLAYTLTDIGAKLLVTDAEGVVKLDAIDPALTGATQLFTVGPPIGRYAAYQQLYSDVPEPEWPALAPGDPCCIIYTGGTTGMPKGVVLSHFYYIVAAHRWSFFMRLGPEDRHYTVLQSSHVSLQTNAVMAPLLQGAFSTIDRWFSVSNFWRRVREADATILDPMGSMYTLLVNQPPTAKDRSHRVRAAWGSTAMLPAHVADEFSARFGIALVPTFGGTEIGGSMVVSNPYGEWHKPGTNGRPNGWCEVQIVGDNDEPLPPNTIGQIVARPTIPFSMMSAYHNNPDRTLECWRNLWFHTGDLGALDEDGWLTFVGRQAHWLRRRSENVSAYEVEAVLTRYPGIAEAVVVGVPSELGEDDVKAFIRPQPGVILRPEEIHAWVETRIAKFKTPRFIEFVDTLPRSAAKQEIERHRLKAMPNDRAWDRERHGTSV